MKTTYFETTNKRHLLPNRWEEIKNNNDNYKAMCLILIRNMAFSTKTEIFEPCMCIGLAVFLGLWSEIGVDTLRVLVEFGLKYCLHDVDEEIFSKMLVK
jgi:hypothetical protein